MQQKIYGRLVITPSMFDNKSIRENLEEDCLQMIIKVHGKLLTFGWSEIFEDGWPMWRLDFTYLERRQD